MPDLTPESKDKKKFIPMGLFYTPKSIEELEQMLGRLSGNEKVIATQFAMHTWNLACHLINED